MGSYLFWSHMGNICLPLNFPGFFQIFLGFLWNGSYILRQCFHVCCIFKEINWNSKSIFISSDFKKSDQNHCPLSYELIENKLLTRTFFKLISYEMIMSQKCKYCSCHITVHRLLYAVFISSADSFWIFDLIKAWINTENADSILERTLNKTQKIWIQNRSQMLLKQILLILLKL